MYNLEVPRNILNLEHKVQNIREEKIKVSEQLFEEAAKLRDRERHLLKKLSNAQKKWQEKEGKHSVNIDSETIADVVSLMTGIPLSKVAESEITFITSQQELSNYIVGQNEAINSISNAIRRSRTGLKKS